MNEKFHNVELFNVSHNGHVYPSVDAKRLLAEGMASTQVESLVLDALKAQALRAIRFDLDKQCQPLFEKYPEYETKAFPVLSNEVSVYEADSSAPTPLIDSICAKTGDDKAAYIALVKEKTAEFYGAISDVIATRRTTEKLIAEKTLSDFV